jgi:hypothetical protein
VEALGVALRRSVGTTGRKILVVGTLLLGVVAAVGVSAHDQTFAGVADPVQSSMSLLVPLIGILLVADVRRDPGAVPLRSTWVAAVLVAAAIGVFGGLVSAVATAVASSSVDAWRQAGVIAVGGVLVQSVAVLVGTGLGLLLRPVVVAFLATIVLPLGLWYVLGAVESVPEWLTPYPSVRKLLAGEMTGLAWVQWLAVVALWDVGLNTVGAIRLKRSAVPIR